MKPKTKQKEVPFWENHRYYVYGKSVNPAQTAGGTGVCYPLAAFTDSTKKDALPHLT